MQKNEVLERENLYVDDFRFEESKHQRFSQEQQNSFSCRLV